MNKTGAILFLNRSCFCLLIEYKTLLLRRFFFVFHEILLLRPFETFLFQWNKVKGGVLFFLRKNTEANFILPSCT